MINCEILHKGFFRDLRSCLGISGTMVYFLRSISQIVLVVLYTGEMLCPSVHGNSYPHCTQTTRSGFGFQPKDITPSYVNVSEFLEPQLNSTSMNLELCPNNVTLKISWNMDQTAGTEMKLCLRIKSVSSEELLHSACVNLKVEQSEHPMIMTCWFPMDHVSYKPIIDVVAESEEATKVFYFYGELDTRELDLSHSCEDICEVSELDIAPVIFCNNTASILFDENIDIKAFSFDASDSKLCNDSPANITGTTAKKLDYKLTCTYDGIGHVKVLYSINGNYCLKYQAVRVVCVFPETVTDSEPEADDFQTFVIFGVVCMVVITAIFVVTLFVAQWLRRCYRVRRRYSGRDIDISGDEGMPFRRNSDKAEENDSTSVSTSITLVDKVIKQEYRKHVTSAFSSDRQFADVVHSSRGQTARQLHKSITMALLESKDSFYRKKMLFLPTPYDTFSRDATNLLKMVFTIELNIPTQCCFDRDVNKRYKTGNRYKWIESILGDFDRILIFLCFTKFRAQIGDSLVEDVLDHLTLTKIRPFCKVAFLHITDSSENLEKNHHGDSFHLNDKNAYKEFVFAVLKYCGKNPAAEQDLMDKLTHCKASRHFLRFIGKYKK